MKCRWSAVLLAALFCTSPAWAAAPAGTPAESASVTAAAAPLAASQTAAQNTVQAAAENTAQTAAEKDQNTYSLALDTSDYTVDTMQYRGQKVVFRSYENRVYVAHPVDAAYESMNIYVPEDYFDGKTIHGYTAATAPIFLPNSVGGYMPGKAGTPLEEDRMSGGPNAILTALAYGYVVAAPGARGRTNEAADGTYTGKAPALLVDMKAAVRYLRYNKGRIPGNTDKIISNGTSAGGALSALLGATGNSPDYEPYLKALGAADERDDIFASSDYCPITDLDHADMPYEWVFGDVHTYYQQAMPAGLMKMLAGEGAAAAPDGTVQNRPANAPAESAKAQELTKKQIKVSAVLKKKFPAYLNSLHLRAADGTKLTLDKKGNGPFKEYIKQLHMDSAQHAIDGGKDLSHVGWLTIENGKVTDMDLAQYAVQITRLKAAPAFDALDLSTGENSEFGSASINARHFTAVGKKYNTVKKAKLADKKVIGLLNPLNYIGREDVTVAPHWRIRHGSADRDTSLAVPAILALRLQNEGYDVNFAVPWGQGHGGDYDLDELFAWADSVCR